LSPSSFHSPPSRTSGWVAAARARAALLAASPLAVGPPVAPGAAAQDPVDRRPDVALLGQHAADDVDHRRDRPEVAAHPQDRGAELLVGKWHGDLRKLRDDAGGEAGGIASRLTEFPVVGPTGASIFVREVQEVWPGVAPYVDAKVTSGAHRVRLPADRESLAGLLAASGQPARLAAALVRVSLSQRAASEVTASVRD